MYCKTIKFWGYTITIGCMPDTPIAELERRAEQIIKRANKTALKGFFLREYIQGGKSLEYMLEEQAKYPNYIA